MGLAGDWGWGCDWGASGERAGGAVGSMVMMVGREERRSKMERVWSDSEHLSHVVCLVTPYPRFATL